MTTASLTNVSGSLLDFRTTWLRAVALAWSTSKDGKDFKSDLLANPKQALENYFGFKWPWTGILDFSVTPVDEFMWIGTDWVWPSNQEDSLTLSLPIYPKQVTGAAIGVSERAIALADYYRARPSIFGRSSGSSPDDSSLITSAAVAMNAQQAGSIAQFVIANDPLNVGPQQAPPGGYLPSGFLDFEVVLTSAIAEAWENPNFAAVITTAKAPGPSAVRAALSTIQNYQVPWKLCINVVNDPTARWTARNGITPSSWDDFTPHLLALNLPQAPPPPEQQSIALASYNATGAEYPFSCCA
jgi:ribosomally synthesized peptide (two-chain TOMM family)